MTKARLEAFSDGVLAIIITIMVLELKIPHTVTFDALVNLLPVFSCYLLSFVIIAIYWGNHHHLLHTVHSVNSKIIWANMTLLFFISLIPFSTGWMGENHFHRNTVLVYSINLLICSIAYSILENIIITHYTHNPGLILALQKQKKKGLISMSLYTASVMSAFFSPLISAIFIIITAIIWIIPDKNIEKAMK